MEIYLGRKPRKRKSHYNTASKLPESTASTSVSVSSDINNIPNRNENSVSRKLSTTCATNLVNSEIPLTENAALQKPRKSILKSSSTTIDVRHKKTVQFSQNIGIKYINVADGNNTDRLTKDYRAEPPSRSLIGYSRNQNQLLKLGEPDAYQNLLSEITSWDAKCLECDDDIPDQTGVLLPVMGDYSSFKIFQE